MDSSALHLMPPVVIAYDGDIESRMLQIKIRKDRTRKVRYDRSYTEASNTKNPDRMSGFFYA